MTVVDELVAVLGYDLRNEGDLKKFQRGLDDTEKKGMRLSKTLGLLVVAGATVAAAAMVKLGNDVLGTAAKFESYAATLETIEGSTEKATKALDWIKKFAKETPYEVDELTAAFVKLRSYGLDPMDGTMVVLGDTASGMGKSIDQVVEALADATTFQFERLKELGITSSQAGDKVTFSWTENGKAMSKSVKKTSEEVTKFLNDTWGRKFGGAMIRQAKTWNGMMSNLGDSWTDFQMRIANSGFFDAMKERLGQVMDIVDAWDKDGTLDLWAKRIGNAFTIIVDTSGRVITRLREIFDLIGKLFGGGWGTGLLIVLGGIAVFLFPVFTLMTAIALAAEDFVTWLQGGDSVIGWIIDQVKALKAEFDALLGTKVKDNASTQQNGLDAIVEDPNFDPKENPDLWEQYRAKHFGPGTAVAPAPVADDVDSYKDELEAVEAIKGNLATREQVDAILNNLKANTDKAGAGSVPATVNDNKQDNRDQSVHVTAPVTVNVQQPAAAPAAVGGAIAGAINQAAQPSRAQGGPAF